MIANGAPAQLMKKTIAREPNAAPIRSAKWSTLLWLTNSLYAIAKTVPATKKGTNIMKTWMLTSKFGEATIAKVRKVMSNAKTIDKIANRPKLSWIDVLLDK